MTIGRAVLAVIGSALVFAASMQVHVWDHPLTSLASVAVALLLFAFAFPQKQDRPTRATLHSTRGLAVGDTVLYAGHRYKVLNIDGTEITWRRLGGTKW